MTEQTPVTAVQAVANKATVTDSLGRVIAIRKLGPLEKMDLFEIVGADLSENSVWMSYGVMASSVTAVDGVLEAFPTSKKHIQQMVKRLGDEGLEAVILGYAENFKKGETGNVDEIKN